MDGIGVRPVLLSISDKGVAEVTLSLSLNFDDFGSTVFGF